MSPFFGQGGNLFDIGKKIGLLIAIVFDLKLPYETNYGTK